MADLEELIDSSTVTRNLIADFNSIADVDKASNWNRETVVSHALHGD